MCLVMPRLFDDWLPNDFDCLQDLIAQLPLKPLETRRLKNLIASAKVSTLSRAGFDCSVPVFSCKHAAVKTQTSVCKWALFPACTPLASLLVAVAGAFCCLRFAFAPVVAWGSRWSHILPPSPHLTTHASPRPRTEWSGGRGRCVGFRRSHGHATTALSSTPALRPPNSGECDVLAHCAGVVALRWVHVCCAAVDKLGQLGL